MTALPSTLVRSSLLLVDGLVDRLSAAAAAAETLTVRILDDAGEEGALLVCPVPGPSRRDRRAPLGARRGLPPAPGRRAAELTAAGD